MNFSEKFAALAIVYLLSKGAMNFAGAQDVSNSLADPIRMRIGCTNDGAARKGFTIRLRHSGLEGGYLAGGNKYTMNMPKDTPYKAFTSSMCYYPLK